MTFPAVWLAGPALGLVLAGAVPAIAQTSGHAAFSDALRDFGLGVRGEFGNEGPGLRASVEAMRRALAAWEPRERHGARPDGPLLVVPGIRPAGDDVGDQKRTLGPRDAVRAGADVLVVGRPIASAPNPAEAARAIKEEMSERG